MRSFESLLDGARLNADELRAVYRSPGVRWNMVTSLDGAATLRGRVGDLTDEADQDHMDIARAAADVVLVGAGTLRNEGYGGFRVSEESVAWRRSQGLPDHPLLVIASRRLNLDPRSALLADAPRRPTILTGRGALADLPEAEREALQEVADVVDIDTESGSQLIAATKRAGGEHVLTEGGPHLLGTLLAEDAVDEALLAISPTVSGGAESRLVEGAPSLGTRARLVRVLREGSLLLAHYDLRE